MDCNEYEDRSSRETVRPRRLLSPDLYRLPALQAAPLLLGQHLVRRTEDGEIRCRIVETESYGGIEDKGSHAFGGRRTARTEVMFSSGGTIYIYLIYGMYHCLNVVTAGEGDPHAVLIRAVEPLTPGDAAQMSAYRGIAYRNPSGLSGGPGKLCRALRIDKSLNGRRLDVQGSPLWLEQGDPADSLDIVQAPRINIPYAEEYAQLPWRFYLRNNPYVSVKDKLEQPFNLR
ncbi:Putative 3-methyladenine DNA glycosylase [Paenibacillus auburnensis]|uniref:Putative 3-methyladenine DNA glycosylase n=1 Tax=Paenibacillus auburnensis TaxID=2905649 RepID=A0ABM9CVZ5_9BACL|nr:DNA-3-methyladenine glycosylase [Paenibacillus auburnensis]CAH1226209.1 Putative 3-methyladenine DNA glycosylase [Paenibacillus auburnensis]